MYSWKDDQILILIKDGNPSIDDLRKAIGLKAVSSVHERLKRLKDKGMISWEEGQHRTLKLTRTAKEYLEEHYG